MKEAYKRSTHILDATDQILGRLATLVATLLQGKNKVEYSAHDDKGDFVVIKNASKVKVSGKKYSDKIYRHHSTHPGGLKERDYKSVFVKNPAEVVYLSVIKMLPKNKLRNIRLKRLKIEK